MSAKMMRFVGNRDINAEGKFLFEILAQVSFPAFSLDKMLKFWL